MANAGPVYLIMIKQLNYIRYEQTLFLIITKFDRIKQDQHSTKKYILEL